MTSPAIKEAKMAVVAAVVVPRTSMALRVQATSRTSAAVPDKNNEMSERTGLLGI
jgi:hypothetical protein